MSLLIHCGGKHASFEEICDVQVPEMTDSYRPVPHGDLVRLLIDEIGVRNRITDPKMAFGLSGHGNQLFGTLTYDLSKPEIDLSAFGNGIVNETTLKQYAFTVGFRNSYDKSMSVGIVGGCNVLVCDNLCLHGSSFKYMRSHTINVWDDLVGIVMREVGPIAAGFGKVVRFQESMKEIPVSTDRGYEVLGLARGRGVLTPTQMNTAIKEWRDVEKDDHRHNENARTSFGLYAGVTEALKLGHVGRKIDEYTGASHLWEELDLVEHIDFETV